MTEPGLNIIVVRFYVWRCLMLWKGSFGGALLVALVMASCSSSDLGTGMNSVDREYKATVKEAHDASLAVLKAEHLQIETDKFDSLGASIVAKRGTSDDRVMVDVKGLDQGKSRVSVRVQPGDKEQAKMLQEKIGQKLTPAAA
jgi:hypothetical protein